LLKKTITYENPFTKQQVTEDHYFHLSKGQLIEMEVEEHDVKYTNKEGEELTGMQALLSRISESNDAKGAFKELKTFIRRAYGKKDGDRFIQGEEVWKEFEGTEAYSEFIFSLFTDMDAMVEFINNIFPGNLEEIAKEVEARAAAQQAQRAEGTSNGAPSEDPTGLTEKTTPQVITTAQVAEMDPNELKSGLAEGRYKLA
jgi:hypothetical protein